jgi:hypothetical protein
MHPMTHFIAFPGIACSLLGLALVAAPHVSQAQDSTLWRLSPEELEAYDKLMESGGEVVWVAPRPGTLRMFPHTIYKANSITPSSAYVQIARGSTVDTTTVVRYFPCTRTFVETGTNTCENEEYSVTTYWHYRAPTFSSCSVSRPLDTLYIGPVDTGDTLRFSYHGDFNSPTVLIYEPAESLWNVRMFTPVPNAECLTNPYALEHCNFWISYTDTLVKIWRPALANLYPYYPAIRNDTVTVGPKKCFIDLDLSVEFANTAIPNYWVRVDTPMVVDSGAHSHSHTSPRRPVGRFIHPIGSTDTTDTLLAQTDANGKIRFRYLASQFGGVERVRAKLLSDTTIFDTLSLATRVPGLQLLPEDTTKYFKVGGTCRHNGPRDDNEFPNCRTPDTDHWGTIEFIGHLQAIVDSFVVLYDSLRLRINDMSLPLGGGFDIGGRWNQDITVPTCRPAGYGHCTHRTGETGDVSFDAINPQGDRVTLNEQQRLDLELIINATSGAPVVHSDHFHVQ